MQSGISASTELLTTFKTFISNPTSRILLVTITNEALTPLTTLPLKSPDFRADLSPLQDHLKSNEAVYILLKVSPEASDGYAAVTYVPNAAPVRQKMLFASTRLTLVRELGIERFRETLFATEAEELSAEGWRRHEAHGQLEAPRTEEEEGLRGAKEAELREGRGTGARKGHHGNLGVEMQVGEGVLEALRCLNQDGCRGTLVQLGFRLPDETLVLESTMDDVEAEAVAGAISRTEPRYSFYRTREGDVVFVYTCPTGSKIKERMVYSTGKSWTRTVAERDAGIVVKRSLEGTEPEEITRDSLLGESVEEAGKRSGGITSDAAAFARPKRPGRR